MRKLSLALFALWLGVVPAFGEWTVASADSDFSAGRRVEHRRVVVKSADDDSATLDLAIFSTKTATLRVIDDPGADSDLATIMKRENCIAGVNGGYFDPKYAPVGLLITDGRVVVTKQKARLLSGVVSVVNGRVQLQRSAEFSMNSKPSAARQCGPFLVDAGRPVTGLNASRPARRSFVLTMGGDRAAVGFSSHVTLAQLGDLLATPRLLGDGKVQRALNLDGGSSSGFWFAGEREPVSIAEQKTVRDYLAVVAR